MRVLIAGCGYVGSALARQLVAEGDTVVGVRRTATPLPDGVLPVVADLTDPTDVGRLPTDVDAVVHAVSADGRDDAAYRAAYVTGLRHLLAHVGPRPRLVHLSSTAVYGQTDGSEVDETSPTRPGTSTGTILLEGESVAHAAGGTVVRLSGIYGPGRTRLLEQVRAGEAAVPTTPTWTNRIHRDDAAGFVAHLLRLPAPADTYCGTDDDPAERGEVIRWLAARLDAPPPPTSAAPRRRGANKRVRNARLRSSGYRLRYPSFRDGYAPLLEPG